MVDVVQKRKLSIVTGTPSDVSLQTHKFKEDDDGMFAFNVIVFFPCGPLLKMKKLKQIHDVKVQVC